MATQQETLQLGPNNFNVVRDYYWTSSKIGKDARAAVPYVTLIEKRVKNNAMIAQLYYGVRGINSTAGEVANELNIFKTTLEGLQKKLDSATDYIAGDAVDNNPIFKKNTGLKPFKGLYPSEDTGSKYVLPYFQDAIFAAHNDFNQGEDKESYINKVGNAVSDIRQEISSLLSPMGYTFVERPKWHKHPTSSEPLQINFPLINTMDVKAIEANYWFVYALTFQNKPRKTNKTTVIPPVIYEVRIPNQLFMPFAYISSLKIDMAGSRRLMKVLGTTTIIPDAYMVSITLTPLIANNQNFLGESTNSGSTSVNISVT